MLHPGLYEQVINNALSIGATDLRASGISASSLVRALVDDLFI